MTDKPFPASYWVVPENFLAGEYPGLRFDEIQTRQRIDSLLEAGFDTFIDLTRGYERPPYDLILSEEARLYRMHVDHRRFPFPDFHAPTRQAMAEVLDAIDMALTGDHKIYLHCVGGIGRTGTTVACWLIRHGVKPTQALAQLREMYGTSAQSALAPRSPEADEQVAFILNWEEDGLA